MRYMLTDDLWAAMEPLVRQSQTHRGGQPPVLPERLFFEALLYLGRTGIPLRDLPAEFGEWDAVYNRLRRRVLSGAMRRLFDLLTADPAFGEVRRVLVDSTLVRAHRHAAGARRRKKRSGRPAARRPRGWAGPGAGGRPRLS
jgi:transposase